MCIYLLVFVYLLRLGLKDKYLRRIAIVWFKYASPCNSSGWQNSRWDIWSNLATIFSPLDNHLTKELMPNILNLMRGISVFFCMCFPSFLSFFVCDLFGAWWKDQPDVDRRPVENLSPLVDVDQTEVFKWSMLTSITPSVCAMCVCVSCFFLYLCVICLCHVCVYVCVCVCVELLPV